jgi:hypothetical protein
VVSYRTRGVLGGICAHVCKTSCNFSVRKQIASGNYDVHVRCVRLALTLKLCVKIVAYYIKKKKKNQNHHRVSVESYYEPFTAYQV